jgi:WD40 repeat protein
VFLSYARGDDLAFVRRLYKDLATAGFAVWFDRESLMSRGLTFHQEIKDAIRTEVDRVVYVGGPKAASSPYVSEEWQFALECDHVAVTPILRLGDFDHVPGELSLLHCEDFRDDSKYHAALARLIASLCQPNPRLGGLFAVPSLPAHFLSRPELMNRLRDALLVDLQKPQVITSADARIGIQGMGGIGKSVLSAALARNRQVRQAYPDGIVWISCGQNLTRDNLLQRQRDLTKHLGGDTRFDSLPQGQGILRELLAAKAVLLVLDDVWHASDAQTFDVLGSRCRILVTTRDAGVLHALHGEPISVALMTECEALQLLAAAVGVQRATLPSEAREVVVECGFLPLAVALAGGMARKRSGDFHSVLEHLHRADLDKIADRQSIDGRHRSIWRAIQASVEVLTVEEQRRFAELAVFANDRTVPEAAVVVLWAHTGKLDALDSGDLLTKFFECSLIQLDHKPDDCGKAQRRFRLHDLLYDYANRIVSEPTTLQHRLIDAYRKKCLDGWCSGPNDGYFFENLARHLMNTGAWPEVEALLTDFSWLMCKCELGLLDSIISDYSVMDGLAPAEMKMRLEIWQAFFREKMYILRRGNEQWPVHKILLQLAIEYADNSPLTHSAEKWLEEGKCDWSWLRRKQRLAHAEKNPCLNVFEGHVDAVLGALEMKDEKILSWSYDLDLRLWEKRSGKCINRMAGKTNWVHGVVQLLNGDILSWAYEPTLRVWNPQDGRLSALLEGHRATVNGAIELQNGNVVSWAGMPDTALRLWDVPRSHLIRALEGHTSYIGGVCELRSGAVLSWSGDGTLRLWDSSSGECIGIWEDRDVQKALQLQNGNCVSWGGIRGGLSLWHGETGRRIRSIEGHRLVDRVVELMDGTFLSWGLGDMAIWDCDTGERVRAFRSESGVIEGSIELRDGNILSWTDETTYYDDPSGSDSKGILRLWDRNSGECRYSLELQAPADGVVELSDGGVLFWHRRGKALSLLETVGAPRVKVMDGQGCRISGALQLRGGEVLSWWEDNTLRIWDIRKSEAVRILKGHSRWIGGALELQSGEVVTWSGDKTLRVWDPTAAGSDEQAQLGSVRVVLGLRSGNVITAGGGDTLTDWQWRRRDANVVTTDYDERVSLWSERTGAHRRLAGHMSGGLSVRELRNGRLLVTSKRNEAPVLLDGESGRELCALRGHTERLEGVLELRDESILSWAGDNTLRVWDGRTGKCRRILAMVRGPGEGAPLIKGVLELSGARAFTWGAFDQKLRVWDIRAGKCLHVLQGAPCDMNGGAVELANGNVFWWGNCTLMLWANRSSRSTVVWKANYSTHMLGALELRSGTLLTWSFGEKCLRIWDGSRSLSDFPSIIR